MLLTGGTDGGETTMRDVDGRLVLSPTDLTKHLACGHLTTLDLAAARRELPKPDQQDDEALQLIFAKGLAHEADYLQALKDEGRSVTEIETVFGHVEQQAAEQLTLEAMRSGVDVVYQAAFYDGWWGGQADFLLKVDEPSALGAWSYEVADTKLARRLKVPALLQMATYAERLAVLQGTDPGHLYVVTGDGVSRPWRLVDVAAYARRARGRLREAVDSPVATAPVPVLHCSQCRWQSRCARQWRDDDDLSLVAFMRGDSRERLLELGIRTVAQLAVTDPVTLKGVGPGTRERLVQQAALQVRERQTGRPSYEVLAPEPGRGLLRLPPTSPGDVYLDFEGDPWAGAGEGRDYLAGLGDRAGVFTSWWAHDREAERRLAIALVDDLLARWQADPGMHVYHYAPYETTALKRMTARHGVREVELDQLLRAERFVDLYAVVRQGLRISKESYSIKKMEAFYWGETRGAGDVADAMSSVIAYERWLVERDDGTLPRIEAYNRDDVDSTRDLHAWLEERRSELVAAHGTLHRPDDVPVEPAELSDVEVEELALAERLTEAGHGLLADLVQWHRREARPRWWDVYRLEDLDDDELVDDGSAIGRLSPAEHVGDVKASRLWRYGFPPQDCKIAVGKQALDVDTHESSGEVVELDPGAGCVVVKLAKKREPAMARGFGPPGPIDDKIQRAAIRRLGHEVLTGRSPLGRSLIEGRVPRDTELRAGEDTTGAVVRLGRALSGEVLAVQGPPGTGKTTVGAELIRRLLDDGRRVGVVATSHSVIGNLLEAVGRPGLQKCTEDDACGAPGIQWTASNADIAGRLSEGTANLVGGTAWLWSREDMAHSVDVLVVDEAGQFSLANAVAVAQAATSLVLLGDPQQLSQPSQALHPDGAGVSVLEHLLGGHDTIPADRGVFLASTWRMHPRIAAFVSDLAYEGRLGAAAGRQHHRVVSDGALSGSGVRFVPTEHAGCAAASDEEVEAVRSLVAGLNGARWYDSENVEHPLGAGDVLVVAPYNSHVGRLRAALPGVRVGTVDKFQGRQAPVVIYTMASSSADDAPRGVDFLYDVHRLNVAVSRAKCLAVIVASPRLLDAAVGSPEQLRKVNALCRFVELAAGDVRLPRRVLASPDSGDGARR